MAMVEQLRNSGVRSRSTRNRVARRVAMGLLLCLAASSPLAAQSQNLHYRYQGNEPPGAIGSWQLLRGGPLPGYFQPVEIKAPQGALISLAVDGNFGPAVNTPVRFGMLIAPVYRLRVTNIPLHEGEEVYPTIEVIDRLYPPVGRAVQFPVPIEITQEDLELALEGNYVMRVIYLEDPNHPLPACPGGCCSQNWFDAGPGANPVEVADRLGRPMAILRLGGRVPDRTGPDAKFLGYCPPFIPLPGCLPLVPLKEKVPAPQPTPVVASNQRVRTVPNAAPTKSRLGFVTNSTSAEPAANK